MAKRLFFVIILSLCWNAILHAQVAVGQWQIYPAKSTSPGVVYDTSEDMVYYMSGTNLFSYDKSSNEIESYNSGNYLSDTGIKDIYYNYEKNYLMIVYSNSNIDLLFGNKKVVNIPDIYNTIMMSSKVINDVAFGKDRVYIATDFGLVIINDKKYEIYESYIYNKAFNKIVVAGNKLLCVMNNRIYQADIQSGMYDFDTYWKVINLAAAPENIKYLYAINDEHLFLSYDGKSYVYDIVSQTFTEQTDDFASLYNANELNKTRTGFLASFDKNVRFISGEVTSDNKLVLEKQINLSQSQIQKGYCSSYDKEQTVWCSSAAGISHFSMNGSTFNWLMEPSVYNTSSVSNPHMVQVYKNKLYVKDAGPWFYTVNQSKVTDISVLDCNTGNWQDLALEKVTYQGNSNSKGKLRSSYNMCFDPRNEGVFFIGSWFDGLHKFNGTQYIGSYNQHNSPLVSNWSMLAEFAQFDSDGNLWAILVNNNTSSTLLGCLPADKNVLSPSETTVADWKTYDVGANISFNNNLLVAKKNALCFVVHGAMVSSTRLTVLDRKTEEIRVFTTFTDQDGTSVGNGILNFMNAVEDQNGNVWLGTTSGPIVLNNVSNIMDSNYRCTRVKVPRNDGTDYADYLLEDEAIHAIVVDGANRKWLGTETSGVYLVSADGTEILQHFTTENSLLPSNNVYSMDINEETGELFVATDLGLASYRSDVSKPAEDYSEVYAFPNPVRPDYTGWITISGLMENSLVKITDVAGNLFYEGYSNGGTFSWDGRNRDGARVKTGVYLVYASQSGSSSGVVTKIMVVN